MMFLRVSVIAVFYNAKALSSALNRDKFRGNPKRNRDSPPIMSFLTLITIQT